MSSADNKANDLQQHGGQTNPNQGNQTLATVTSVMTSIAPQISAQPTQLIWTGSSMNEVASQMQTTQQQTQMTISSQAQQPPPPIPTPAPQPIAPAPQQQMNTSTTMSTLQQTLQQQINHQTAQSTLSHPGVSPTPMPQQQVRDQWAWKTDEQGNTTPMCVQVIQQPMAPGQAYLQQLYNTQGQLLMPGNLASQPGGMNSPIQVITAGKLGLPNLLSTGPHMLTATSGGKQIIQQGHPGSAAGSYTIPSTCANQTLVIGQLGMISSQPNVLPNSSGTTYTVSKPNDLQKAFGTSLPQGLTWAPQALQTSQAFLTAPSSIFIRPGQQDGMYIQSAPPPAIQQGQPSNVNGSSSVLPTPQMPPKARATLENVNMATNVNVGAVNQNIQPKPRNVSTIMPSLTLTQIRPASSVSTQTAMTTGQTGQIQAPKSQAKARGRPGVTRSSPNPKVVTGSKDDHGHSKVNAVTSMAAAMPHGQNPTAKVIAQMVPPSVSDSVSVSPTVSQPSPCPQKNNSSAQTKLTVTQENSKQSSQNIPISNSTPISVGISVVNPVSGVNVASTETDNGVKQAFNGAPGSLVTSAGVSTPGDVVKTVVSSTTNLTKTSMTVVSSSGVSLSSVTPLAPLAPLPNVTQNGTADVNGVNGDIDGRLDGDSHENGVKDKPPQRAIVKPHLLTHVIEGFVIQEGVEPFPLTRNGSVLDKHPGNKPSHAHADKENHVLHDGEPPKKKSAIEVTSDPKCDISKCEFCGKVKSKMRIKASKKFCSNTCAKRYTNLGPPPAPELPKDAENVYNFDGSDDPKDIDLATLNKKWKNVAENIAQSERDKMDVDEPPNSISAEPSKDETQLKNSAVLNGPKNCAPEDDISSKINPVKWTVNEVCDFIRNIPGCTEYADDFALQEIDGQALMLLKEDHLMSAMSMKLGPALKICAKIDTMRGESKAP